MPAAKTRNAYSAARRAPESSRQLRRSGTRPAADSTTAAAPARDQKGANRTKPRTARPALRWAGRGRRGRSRSGEAGRAVTRRRTREPGTETSEARSLTGRPKKPACAMAAAAAKAAR
uniref:Uncharacterized protein n=1 Tax=Arundo donax TaxID=35708 RepID=A0A0A9DCW6_ARUDO